MQFSVSVTQRRMCRRESENCRRPLRRRLVTRYFPVNEQAPSEQTFSSTTHSFAFSKLPSLALMMNYGVLVLPHHQFMWEYIYIVSLAVCRGHDDLTYDLMPETCMTTVIVSVWDDNVCHDDQWSMSSFVIKDCMEYVWLPRQMEQSRWKFYDYLNAWIEWWINKI